MSDTLQLDYVTGKTVYFLVRSSSGQAWRVDTNVFEAYATANLAHYNIAAAEQGAASGYFQATVPAAIAAGAYSVTGKDQSGGGPAETDITIASGNVSWDGTKLVYYPTSFNLFALDSSGRTILQPTGLDAIAITDPGAPASHTTLSKMIVAVWRALWKKETCTATQYKRYADDGTTINATSTVSDDGTTQTKGTFS